MSTDKSYAWSMPSCAQAGLTILIWLQIDAPILGLEKDTACTLLPPHNPLRGHIHSGSGARLSRLLSEKLGFDPLLPQRGLLREEALRAEQERQPRHIACGGCLRPRAGCREILMRLASRSRHGQGRRTSGRNTARKLPYGWRQPHRAQIASWRRNW